VVAGNADPGARDVTVTLTDGRSVACAACFTVVPGPQVTDVSPNQIGPGALRTITVTGANLRRRRQGDRAGERRGRHLGRGA
jgi:hypothetical protein